LSDIALLVFVRTKMVFLGHPPPLGFIKSTHARIKMAYTKIHMVEEKEGKK
jgi:hypothetical protein